MAIDFPASPTNGQTFLSGGIAYTYDGTKWTATASGGSMLGQGNTSAAVIDTGSDGRFVVTTEGSERLRVDEQGRVAIGTTSPGAPLHVAGTVRVGAADTSDANLQIGNGLSGNRASYLDLTGDTTYSSYGLRVLRNNTGANASSQLLHRGTGNLDILTQEVAPIVFGINNNERARIDSSGRLLVGTTTGSGRLTVAGNAVGVPVALTDGATITADFSAANNFSITLGGNRTLANPSNLAAGQAGTIVVTQDATGSRTLAYGSNWKFPGGTAPTLTTTANAVDAIAYYVESSTRITARLIADVK